MDDIELLSLSTKAATLILATTLHCAFTFQISIKNLVFDHANYTSKHDRGGNRVRPTWWPCGAQIHHQALVHQELGIEVIEDLERQEAPAKHGSQDKPPSKKPATRGRKKKEPQPPAPKQTRAPLATKTATPPASQADPNLTNQIGEILQLVKAQVTRPVNQTLELLLCHSQQLNSFKGQGPH